MGAWCVAIIKSDLYKIVSTIWIYLTFLMAPILQDVVQNGPGKVKGGVHEIA